MTQLYIAKHIYKQSDSSHAMETETLNQHKLHIFFFPYLALGHIIPLSQIARLFVERGVKVSFVTTKGNVPHVSHLVDNAVKDGHNMQILQIPFPCEEVGLPVGCENTNSLPLTDSALEKFGSLILKLDGPFEKLIRDHQPDCVIVDEFYHWASDVAISQGVPRIVFGITSHFAACICDQIEFHDIHLSVPTNTEPFIVPGIPHKLEITKAELPKLFHYPKFVLGLYREAQRKSYGMITNSFDELAPEYVNILKKDSKLKLWNIGPVTVQAKNTINGTVQGDDELKLKSWLDSKANRSVLYFAFGSECSFKNEQLHELASGLELSGYPFVWVVRGGGGGLETIEEWLPGGFERRVEGRGVIIRKWAPQMMILNHSAVGGFVMQCGWNSLTEAMGAGLPVIAWPLHSEQFITERLVVNVLRIGVGVLEGIKRSIYPEEKELVKAGKLKRAIERVMGEGEEAEEMRKNAMKFKGVLGNILKEGGSSYSNLSSLIDELSALAKEKRELKVY